MANWDFNSWDFDKSFTGQALNKMKNAVSNSVNSYKVNSRKKYRNSKKKGNQYGSYSYDYKYNYNYDFYNDAEEPVITPPPAKEEVKAKKEKKVKPEENVHVGEVLVRKTSVVPIYLMAIPWIVCAFFLPLCNLVNIAIVCAISIAVFILSRLIFKGEKVYIKEEEKKVETGDSLADNVIAKGKEFLKQMRQADDDIDNEILSEQIRKLEQIFGKILDFIEDNPTKANEVRTFMRYYIPATLKLLNYYDKLEELHIDGENINSSMKNIENSMQKIVRAFEKQLDSLFEDDAMDISTDISVLEGMFAQEGLTDDDIKK